MKQERFAPNVQPPDTTEIHRRHDPTLPELTAACPQYLRLENLPDNCTVAQVAVFSQRSLRFVRDAIRRRDLEARQAVEAGTWRIRRDAAVRWISLIHI